MSITLYGSLPSPYVRRIRLFLDTMTHEFHSIDIYNDTIRSEFTKISPIKKLPVLIDEGKSIFDSHVIYQHIRRKRGLAEASIEECNLVSAIDAVTDSLIILLLGKRSELPIDSEKLIFKLQLERIPDSLSWLNQQAEQGAFNEWHFGTMALISLIDWAQFRELYDFAAYPKLLAVIDQHKEREIVRTTAPE